MRPAATVMIVRDTAGQEAVGASPVEVFLLRRVASMAFAPSTIVFPGGGVDSRDGVALPWAGPGVFEWSVRLGADEDSTRMLVVAAVREVFEECGVLFASTTEDGPLVDVSSPEWQQVRAGLVARELSLSDVLLRHGLCLRTDLLRAHAHWVTPVFEPRRFDTRFFVALMPEGRAIDGDTSEADHSGWFDPAAVLADYADGRAIVLPPTLVCLEDLTRAQSAADFFEHEPVIRRIMPELVVDETGDAVMRVDFAGTKAPRG
ncbi:MAG: NUDIX hydrolase [Actinomycetales bacterium]|nr:NUDIX hydrolase [Candidatus Phosphoribacter baldrii]